MQVMKSSALTSRLACGNGGCLDTAVQFHFAACVHCTQLTEAPFDQHHITQSHKSSAAGLALSSVSERLLTLLGRVTSLLFTLDVRQSRSQSLSSFDSLVVARQSRCPVGSPPPWRASPCTHAGRRMQHLSPNPRTVSSEVLAHGSFPAIRASS